MRQVLLAADAAYGRPGPLALFFAGLAAAGAGAEELPTENLGEGRRRDSVRLWLLGAPPPVGYVSIMKPELACPSVS